MHSTSVTVTPWRSISVVDKTNVFGFSFLLKTFAYSCCPFVEIVVSWNNDR